MGDQTAVDGMYQDGFLCPLAEQVMGETAETLAAQYRIPREEQDAFALRSQQRAARAWEEGRFRAEVVPVKVPARGGDIDVSRDEHPRADTTPASLAKLPTVFKETDGTVTAGNSSGITDGAAAVVVLGADRAAELGGRPMARVLGVAAAGVAPPAMGTGAAPPGARLLGKPRQRPVHRFDARDQRRPGVAGVPARGQAGRAVRGGQVLLTRVRAG